MRRCPTIARTGADGTVTHVMEPTDRHTWHAHLFVEHDGCRSGQACCERGALLNHLWAAADLDDGRAAELAGHPGRDGSYDADAATRSVLVRAAVAASTRDAQLAVSLASDRSRRVRQAVFSNPNLPSETSALLCELVDSGDVDDVAACFAGPHCWHAAPAVARQLTSVTTTVAVAGAVERWASEHSNRDVPTPAAITIYADYVVEAQCAGQPSFVDAQVTVARMSRAAAVALTEDVNRRWILTHPDIACALTERGDLAGERGELLAEAIAATARATRAGRCREEWNKHLVRHAANQSDGSARISPDLFVQWANDPAVETQTLTQLVYRGHVAVTAAVVDAALRRRDRDAGRLHGVLLDVACGRALSGDVAATGFEDSFRRLGSRVTARVFHQATTTLADGGHDDAVSWLVDGVLRQIGQRSSDEQATFAASTIFTVDQLAEMFPVRAALTGACRRRDDDGAAFVDRYVAASMTAPELVHALVDDDYDGTLDDVETVVSSCT